ncbi:MAG: IS66 family transposase, partial [Syntrophobacteraceae bacterium]|nr:IS66 family transposase [Syntrophobacteraceae bacterium]
MLLNTTTLPNSVDALKILLVDLDAQYRARIEFLEERIRFFQKELFGRKTEKRAPETELQQLHLFNEAEVLTEEEKAEKPLVVPEHTRRKPKRKPIPDDLPRVDVIHDIPEEEKTCACGAELSRIGEEVSEKLDIVPAKIQVLRHIRYKYACKQCEGVESTGPTVVIAPPPAELIPKGLATAGLVAYIAIAKYCDALPLYRQEKIFARYGVELTRSTMASWMVKAAECCQPLIGLLRQKLISGPLVNADETPVQVLDEPGRANTATSYMWVFRGGDPGRPAVFYRYSPTRSGDVPREILQGYGGYLQTDAFSAYDGLEGQVRLVGCFAHVRRNFVRVIDARGKSGKKPGSAEVALDYIRQLYAVEKASRNQELSPSEHCLFRKEKAEEILSAFKTWMDKQILLTPPKGLLGKALSYSRTHWPKIIRYIQ